MREDSPLDPMVVEKRLEELLRLRPDDRESEIAALAVHAPDLAEALRSKFRTLARFGMIEMVEQDVVAPDLSGFELMEPLGEGAMGVVYRARELALDREVALKLIRKEHLLFPGARERFERETRAAARLRHPAIVPVFQAGESDQIPYYSMELVEGASLDQAIAALADRAPESRRAEDLLRSVLGTDPTLDTPAEPWIHARDWSASCVELLLPIIDAVEHAHAEGVVHRDIKPSNILLGRDGRPRLADFGLASFGTGESLVASQSTVGTLLYMAPEQVRGAAGTRQSDVYSLGATLYELLAGQAPYLGADRKETEQLIIDARLAPLRARNRTVPAELALICEVAMSPEPSHRYSSCRALAEDLRRFLTRQPILARPASLGLRLRRWVQRNPARAAAIGLAAILLIGVPAGAWQLESAHAEELGDLYDAEKAARETAEARATALLGAKDYLSDLFHVGSLEATEGEVLTAERILQRGSAEFENLPPEEPGMRGWLALTLAEVHQAQASAANAQLFSMRASELADLAEDHLLGIRAEMLRARSSIDAFSDARDPENLDQADLAIAMVEDRLQSPQLSERELASFRAELAGLRGHLAFYRGELEEATDVYRSLVATPSFAQLPADRRASLWKSYANLLALQTEQGMPPDQVRPLLAEALKAIGHSLQLYDEIPGPQHRRSGSALAVRSRVQMRLGQREAARASLEEALDSFKAWDPESLLVGETLRQLGQLALSSGQHETALEQIERADALFATRRSLDHPPRAQIGLLRLQLLPRLGRIEEAMEATDQVEGQLLAAFPGPHINHSVFASTRAEMARRMNQPDEVLHWTERGVQASRDLYGPDHPNVASALVHRSSLLRGLRMPDEILRTSTEALACLGDQPPPHLIRMHRIALAQVADARYATGEYNLAISDYEAARTVFLTEPSNRQGWDCMLNFARLLLKTEDPTGAMTILEEFGPHVSPRSRSHHEKLRSVLIETLTALDHAQPSQEAERILGSWLSP